MVETLITSVVHPFWIITGLLPQRIALWVKIQLVLMSLLVGTLNREISIEYIRLACLASVEEAQANSHMKRAGMLVVSIRGVNLRFWSRLGCSGQNATIFSLKVSSRVALEEILKKIRNLQFVLFTRFM